VVGTSCKATTKRDKWATRPPELNSPPPHPHSLRTLGRTILSWELQEAIQHWCYRIVNVGIYLFSVLPPSCKCRERPDVGCQQTTGPLLLSALCSGKIQYHFDFSSLTSWTLLKHSESGRFDESFRKAANDVILDSSLVLTNRLQANTLATSNHS
jgi:hypothetical protein